MIFVYSIVFIIVILGLSVFFGAPYVPSHRRDVHQLFTESIPLHKNDVVLDMGSGDGIVLREASKKGALAIGYEIHPVFVLLSKFFSRHDKRVHIYWRNAWRMLFPDNVTLIYIFSVGRDAPRLIRKVQHEANRLGRSLSLVCYGNPLPNRRAIQHGPYFLYVFEPLQ